MLHQVIKRFKADGLERNPGEIVETSGWRNERLLLEHRFIGVPSVPQKDANKVAPGARFVQETESSGANSKPEPQKATLTKTAKPAILRRQEAVVGKVPVANKAKQVKTNG